jgi:hypothetical protein
MSCAAQGKECGRIPDGCGLTIDCGSCSGSDQCKSNRCVNMNQ